MILDNYINIPVTCPVVKDSSNRFEMFLKGFFSTSNKVYVVRRIQAQDVEVELRQLDFHLKGLWKVIFIASLIGPLCCLIVLGFSIRERKIFKYKLIEGEQIIRSQRELKPQVNEITPEKIIPASAVKQKQNSLWPIVTQSIEKSKKQAVPLAPRFYVTNIVIALSNYLEADPTLANFKSVRDLTNDKMSILEEVIDQTHLPRERMDVLKKELDTEFQKLTHPLLKIKLCRGIINSVEAGENWLKDITKAFYELVELLPENLEEWKQDQEYLDLKRDIESLAENPEKKVLSTIDLTQFREVYNPVVVKLNLPEMDLKNFTDDDEILAKEIQANELNVFATH